MPLWEYKHITGGAHGFASSALLEAFLNKLGSEEWEIIHYQPRPDNPLAFNALARRPTNRDWTLEDAVSAAAAREAEKLREEFEAKLKVRNLPEEGEKENGTSGFNTGEEEATPEESGQAALEDAENKSSMELDEWEDFDEDLPTFFDAIKPFFRPNNKGPGQSVGVDYLAKHWELSPEELKGALRECGFSIPDTPDAEAEYLEFDEDLYWLNINGKGQLFINTREKPRPVFKIAKASKLSPDDPAFTALAEEAAETVAEGQASQAGKQPQKENTGKQDPRESMPAKAVPETLPGEASALLEMLYPKMRRNRHSQGASGSIHFLARAFGKKEKELLAALAAIGLSSSQAKGEKPSQLETGGNLYRLGKDGKGNIWIHVRPVRKAEDSEAEAQTLPEKAPGAASPQAEENKSNPRSRKKSKAAQPPGEKALDDSQDRLPEEAASAPAQKEEAPLSLKALRALLTPDKKGGASGELAGLAAALETDEGTLKAFLSGLGIPPAAVKGSGGKADPLEHEGELYWLSSGRGKHSLRLNVKKVRGKAVKKKAGKSPAATASKTKAGKSKAAAKKKD